ncbi:MAG: cyclopropane fatty acyl phospholipid synthase [Rhodothermales bacterium]
MNPAKGEAYLEKLLRPSGVRINGDRPFDIRITNNAFYHTALPNGNMGILEAYIDGWWDTDQLDVLTDKVRSSGLDLPRGDKFSLLLAGLQARLFNRESRKRSKLVRQHYDLGNDLFSAMLDQRMVYSCGYWKDARTLDEAQEAKLDLVCRKIGLKPGMHVLDIGCGWGSFCQYAAETYGVSVVGITLSKEQVKLGKERCAGLPVELRLMDYRELQNEMFDAVVSIGMFEHVGPKNHREYMKMVRRCLKPEGLFLLHTIGNETTRQFSQPWVEKYIFAVGVTPSVKQIGEACEGIFVVEDWHNFGPDYDKTLMAWYHNFDAHWPELRPQYGDRFYRIWTCHLLTAAGGFRARKNQLWQLVLSPSGVRGGYHAIR